MIFSDSRIQLGLQTLIKEKKISLETLEKTTKISSQDLNNFICGKEIDIDLDKCTYLADLYDFLTDGMSMIEDDERLKGIIDVLIVYYKMTFESIALCTNISMEKIKMFYENPVKLSFNEKYHLAIRIFFLYYIFKFPNYQNL